MTPQALDAIHTVVIHCTASVEGEWVTADDIDAMHRNDNGWSMIGYHRLIRLDGAVEQGRPYTRRGAHVKGNNINTVGVAMVGGLGLDRKPKNTYTPDQFHALLGEIHNYIKLFPNLQKIRGHRSYSPDLNGDGLITPDEWIKDCPCFSVNHKLLEWRLEGYAHS